jgi:hypothetical protein
MKRPHGARAACVALALAWAAPAAAAPAQEPEAEAPIYAPEQWDGLRLFVQGRGGITSPVGTVGASLELSAGRYFSAWAGAGHNSLGVQTALMAHGRLPVTSWWAVAFGLAISRARLETTDGGRSTAFVFYPELSLEARTRSYGQVRLGAGFGRVLGADEVTSHWLPLANLAVGFQL